MSWLKPLNEIRVRRTWCRPDGTRMPNTSREVEINGMRFESMGEACAALQCSYSVIYRLIGEAWRYDKRHR